MKAFEGHWDTTVSAHLFHSHWSSLTQPLMKSGHKASINNLSLRTSVWVCLLWGTMLSWGWACHISWVEINVSVHWLKRSGVGLLCLWSTALVMEQGSIWDTMAMSITACLSEPSEVLTGLNRLVCIHAWVHTEVQTGLISWESSKEN